MIKVDSAYTTNFTVKKNITSAERKATMTLNLNKSQSNVHSVQNQKPAKTGKEEALKGCIMI